MRTYQHNQISRWLSLHAMQPFARAIMVVSAVAVLATGVTYAALQSQSANLTGNSISTATADLRIGTSPSTFSNTRVGFNFANLVPGTAAMPTDGNMFYLKNYGSTPMQLKVAINSTPVNTSGVDLNKVYFVISRVDVSSVSQKLSIASLVDASSSDPNSTSTNILTDQLVGGVVGQYKLQVFIDSDAFSGSSAAIGGIDLVFNGTAIAD